MMTPHILRGRRFTPLLITSVFGAMNDNILRAAAVVLATMLVTAEQAATLSLLAGAALTLPFVLFSGLAGAAADKFEKARLIRATKLFEVAISLAAAFALVTQSLPGLIIVIFAFGMQSAFFGPLKQGWLPERLPEHELVAANAWLETGTFLAILGGTVVGGVVTAVVGVQPVAAILVTLAVAGLLSSQFLTKGQPACPELRLPANPVQGNIRLLRQLGDDLDIKHSAILQCWFWAMGALYLSVLPVFLKAWLESGELLVTAVMAIFAAGIGIGSFLVHRVLRGVISVWPVAPAAGIVAVASLCLYAGLHLVPQGGGIAALVTSTGGLMVTLSVLVTAIAGGLYVVPLAALVQQRAQPAGRARVIAGVAVATSLSVAGTTIATGLLVSAGLPIRGVFLITALSAIAITWVAFRFFPRESLQGIMRVLLTTWFRVEVRGAEHLDTKGPVVFAPNHSSLIDGPMLFALIARRTAFAMTEQWADTPMMRRIAGIVPIVAVDNTRPVAAKGLVKAIQGGQSCVVFPEGRLTATGALMKIYPGTAWIVDQSQAPIVPVHFEGLEFCRWSRSKAGYPRLLAPKVRIVVGAPRRLDVNAALKGKTRREAAVLSLGDVLEENRRDALDRHETIPEALADTAIVFGAGRHAIADPMGTSLTHGQIRMGAAVLARALDRNLMRGEVLGVLLPTTAGMPVVLTALWRLGVVPAMMNPTLGHGPALQGLNVACVTRVLSSRAMVRQAKLEEMVAHLEAAGIAFLWVEELRASLTARDKAAGWVSAQIGTAYRGRPVRGRIGRDDVAVILFTSGTEGAPKGVALTHGNLLANTAQLRARTDVNASDKMLSALPLFHSFGLTGGILLPLLCGSEIMAYPNPLHMKQIPEAAYQQQTTVIFGTDTFLSGWGRRADSHDFASVRAAIAGAEPVKAATRAMWSERFGVRILEGYGATECAPVLALNTPIVARDGTVGRIIPGMQVRLEPVPGLTGQRLFVRGPNVMKGYLLAETPGQITPPVDGWYDTGDAVQIDPQGFMTITGRIKRFAKVGGEMVSLAAVEALGARTWPGLPLAAVALPDPRKGNRVVLCVAPLDEIRPLREELQAQARREGIAEIMLPAEIRVIDAIPLMGSGKTDYPKLTQMIAS